MLHVNGQTIEAVHENDAWIGTYRGMPGSPELTEVLLRLGFDEFSRNIVTVPNVKAVARSVGAEEATTKEKVNRIDLTQ